MAVGTSNRQNVRDQYAALAVAVVYDPVSGVFTWARPKGTKIKAGQVAGHINPLGYVVLGFGRKLFLAHRLAWFIMTGDLPPAYLDHVNRNQSDNSWQNIRSATACQNMYNRTLNKNSSSKAKGVTWHSLARKWHARISIQGKRVSIGLFHSKEQAAAAYAFMADLHHGDFACEG